MGLLVSVQVGQRGEQVAERKSGLREAVTQESVRLASLALAGQNAGRNNDTLTRATGHLSEPPLHRPARTDLQEASAPYCCLAYHI